MLLNLETIKNITQKVKNNIEKGNFKQAANISRQLSSIKVASILTQVSEESAAFCLKEMDKKRAARVLASMSAEYASRIIMNMNEEDRIKLLNSLPLDNIDDFLEAIDDEQERQEIISSLENRLQKHIAKITRYPSNSAGRIMSPYFLSVKGTQTVRETLESIVSAPPEVERTPYIYVVDQDNKPSGVVSIKDLLRVALDKKVKEVMNPNLIVVGVEDSDHEAALVIRNRRFMMIPVVDNQGYIVGVITFDDATKVLSEDTINQFTSVAGTHEESFFTPALESVKSRLPWMMLNVFLNMGAVAVIAGFEATIATVAILAAFIPMITDMGGNVGIQSLSVAIRSIALGEARLRDFRKVIKKELSIGAFQGVCLGVLFALIAFFLRGNPYLGLVAGAALGFNVLIAGIIGGILPFIIKAMGKDPAMMTGPFLTTITDISGVSIYLGLATLFIRFF